MALSEEQIKTIARDMAKKVALKGFCKDRAQYVLGIMDDLDEASRQVGIQANRDRNPYRIAAVVNETIHGMRDFTHDSSLKETVIQELSDIQGKALGGEVPGEVRERIVHLREEVLGDMLTDFKACECDSEPAMRKLPTRRDVKVTVWEERDNLAIAIIDKATEQITYAEWRDDDARQMFEDGFFKRGIIHRQLDQVADDKMTNSIFEYAEDMGILAK